ncbi:single-stranded-DNA-specific exonuclease RecJ [Anaerocolumna sp. AGMB13025]|uniref:single-stranded-DNA-specific exonuclease RecJ n=1 Tax=Anaerocolumna sp. AGMB13025 TaxID=3039116 RepID=UPI00241EE351|nr:single-stranded-DNA-specific exonuclease RecJ [Anaerocolumna sp. AGMB13025]WFR56178.1 single-stranded-DNA-specific exonuclease RecJ [Anaerocolumna sp. AGMB13025]
MEKWVLKNKKADFAAMTEQYKISEVIARLLINRNQESKEDIEAYLNPALDRLHNPLTMKDLVKACDILTNKIKQGKKIRIVGDYDVDGVASTYVLYTALIKCKALADYEIPDRIKDGYGININIIEEAYRDGVDTILTCDNGISAAEQIDKAKELGMTVIITDHHDVPFVESGDQKEYIIPKGDAVVNPKQWDCEYPWKSLCGAAVAFKLIQILYDRFGIDREEMDSMLEIVAIATVCDVMDLVNENRVIVKHGLNLLKQTKNLGLKALIEKNNINLSGLSAYHLGYIIGPCLNASGRLDSAKKGLKLLLSETKEEADLLAEELKTLNDIRKDMTAKGLEAAIKLVEEGGMVKDKVLVVYLKDCHESLAGIIAGRLKERYNKPAIVLTEAEGAVKGSCRSIEQYNIYEELTKCKHLLLKYGGHPMAAGLSLEEAMVSLLRVELNQNTRLTEEDLIPKISIDILLPLGYLSEELVTELERLEPFGKGNIKPVFAEKNLRIRKASILGKNSNVLKFQVVNDYGRVMDALYFGEVESFLNTLSEGFGQEEVDNMFRSRSNAVRLSVTYYPSMNEYGGNRTVQIIIQNYQIIK